MEPSTWLAQYLSDVVVALAVAGAKLERSAQTAQPTTQREGDDQ